MRAKATLIFIVGVLGTSLCLAQEYEAAAWAEEVTFERAGVRLVGTILTPVEAGGTAVIMLPGSGPATRDMLRSAAQRLVESGITVMIYDKRGSGESGGDWAASSLDDLAHDAIAAMNLLRSRAGIEQVGLWAHSQGNWVATRAAELDAEPAFLIAVSGGGVSPYESERHAYNRALSSASDQDRAAANAFVDAYFDYLSGRLSYPALGDMIEQARTTAWYVSLGIEQVLVSPAFRSKWEWVAKYDPARSAGERRFPTLVLLGGADHTIPLESTIADWKNQLSINGVPGSRIDIFIGRDHHLRLAGTNHGHGVTTDQEIWDVINVWLDERHSTVPSGPGPKTGH
ncbi:MAG: alpha/beta hydrolase [Gammaproteobacteria bacterium]|nr:alpha/beta hydrolase [Gammaproteobacteria bacterium]